MISSFNGEFGLPCPENKASAIISPPTISKAPGSSSTTSPTPRIPIADLALLLMTRNRVLVAK